MSRDHVSEAQLQAARRRPRFLGVLPGMAVIVRHESTVPNAPVGPGDWWMGKVLTTSGAARDPSVFNLLQIINIDTGEVRWVNADLIVQILPEPHAS